MKQKKVLVPYSTGFVEEQAKEFTHDIVKSVAATNKPGKLMLETRHLDVWAKKGTEKITPSLAVM